MFNVHKCMYFKRWVGMGPGEGGGAVRMRLRSHNPIFIIDLKLVQCGFTERAVITYPNPRVEGGITAFLFLGYRVEQNWTHRTINLLYITLFVISDFRRDADEICPLLRYYAASNGNPLPTFGDNVLVPSSRTNKSWPSSGVLRSVEW
jgi:hypothetical protein